jgi:hypothetical protein
LDPRYLAAFGLGLAVLFQASAGAAELTDVGSSTIGEHVIPAAAQAFTAQTGIRLNRGPRHVRSGAYILSRPLLLVASPIRGTT